MKYILIFIVWWDMAYRGAQTQPVSLGEFDTKEACVDAGHRVVQEVIKSGAPANKSTYICASKK